MQIIVEPFYQDNLMSTRVRFEDDEQEMYMTWYGTVPENEDEALVRIADIKANLLAYVQEQVSDLLPRAWEDFLNKSVEQRWEEAIARYDEETLGDLAQ